ncbi:MAG: glycosyltransferase family 4 protein [bacterium]
MDSAGVVALVTQNPYPSDVDVRTRKFVETFVTEGYRVVVISNGGYGSEVCERSTDLVVYRLGRDANNGIASWLGHPVPFNPVWSKWIRDLCWREKPNVVVINGLRLFLPAYMAAKALRIPVISDLSEHFPGMGQMQNRSGLEKLLKNRPLISLLEAMTVRLADEVWVVVEDQRERLGRLYGAQQKIGIVSNTPIVRTADNSRPSARRQDTGVLTIGYVGLLEKGRGLQSVMRALRYLTDRTDIKFVIVGDGKFGPALMALAKELDVERCVEFRGWVPSDQLDDIISQFDVGIIPHFVCEFTHHTLPNKLFDFMSLGVPVLVTPMKPVARVVEAERCGIIISEDPREIARTIASLKDRTEELREMGARGRIAVRGRYNWSRESKVILRSVERWVREREMKMMG